MTRRKVTERIRTQNACDQCKRRKSKCDGEQPCARCIKVRDACFFTPVDRSKPEQEEEPAAKKRCLVVDTYAGARGVGLLPIAPLAVAPTNSLPHTPAKPFQSFSYNGHEELRLPKQTFTSRTQLPHAKPDATLQPRPRQDSAPGLTRSNAGAPSPQDQLATVPEDEEYQTEVATRMLWADARIVWLGHSAILTSLNFIRTSVLDLVGCTAFTVDKNSGRMLEHPHGYDVSGSSSSAAAAAAAAALPSTPVTHDKMALLGSSSPFEQESSYCPKPDERLVRHLVNVYFVNTQAFLDLASPPDIDQDIGLWLQRRQLRPSAMCRLYLVLAIGSVFDKLSGQAEFDTADLYYRTSLRILNTSGADASGDELVAIWALRSVYMLSTSRRNDAWDHVRTAIGLAIGAGMHTPRQTKQIIMQLESGGLDGSPPGRTALKCFSSRCSVWKSLFVLDSFLSALVGRPHAVPDMSCSEDGWDAMTEAEQRLAASLHPASGLGEAVQTSRTVFLSLKQMYDPNSTSLRTRTVREVADDYKSRQRGYARWDAYRHRRNHDDDDDDDHHHHQQPRHQPTPPAIPQSATTKLHLELYRQHATIILTKPCFLWLYKWRCERLPRPDDLADPSRLRQWAARAKAEPGFGGFSGLGGLGGVGALNGIGGLGGGAGGVTAASTRAARSSVASLSSSSSAVAAVAWNDVSPRARVEHAVLQSSPTSGRVHPSKDMMKKVSAACVKAACLSMELMATAFETGDSFAPRNPFLMSFLFAAILIIMSNEIACMHENGDYETHAQWATDILAHCARTDPQGERLYYIVSEFKKDIVTRKGMVTEGQYLIGHLLQPANDLGGRTTLPMDLIPSVRSEAGLRPKRINSAGWAAPVWQSRVDGIGPPTTSDGAAHGAAFRFGGGSGPSLSLSDGHDDQQQHAAHGGRPPPAGEESPPSTDGGTEMTKAAVARRISLPPLHLAFPGGFVRDPLESQSLCSSSSNGDVEFEASDGIFVQTGSNRL